MLVTLQRLEAIVGMMTHQMHFIMMSTIYNPKKTA